MRSIVLALCLCVSVSSCQLVEPQYRPLTQGEITTLEAKLGDLGTANAELLRVEVERLICMQVDSVAKFQGEVLAKLTPPAQEIATEVGTTFFERIIADPTATGAGAALMAAVAAGLAAWRRRKSVTGTVTGVVTIPVPGTVPKHVEVKP